MAEFDKPDDMPYSYGHAEDNGGYPGSIIWSNPEPLAMALMPVLPITPDMIPEPLRDWLTDISYRSKCPLDFVASAAMVMLSSLIGTRLVIKPKSQDSWTVVPNLWGAMIGDPSTMKTPSASEVFKPLDRISKECRKEYEAKLHQYEEQKIGYEAQKSVFQSQEKDRLKNKAVDNPVIFPELPNVPTEKRFKTNDATVEKLCVLLNENSTGLLQYRDELIGLLASWDRAGHEGDRAFYLEAWNGGNDTTVDRIGRGTMYVENVCVSVFGGIQPAKLCGYLAAATGYDNDGFVQRLQLAVYPDKPKWDYVDEQPDIQARDRAFKLIQSIADSNFSAIGYIASEEEKFAYTRFDSQAQAIFKQWLIRLETNVLANETGLLQEHFTKYRSLMPSLALILHVVTCEKELASTSQEKKVLVSKDAAITSIRWCEYLMSHARRIYGLLDLASITAAKELLRHIRMGQLADRFTVRDVTRKSWSQLADKESVESAIGELIGRHYLIEQEHPQGQNAGRPKAPFYLIHPEILSKCAQ